MDFNDYQAKITKFDHFNAADFTANNDLSHPSFIEKLLGLTGEAGKTADKCKKIIRDQNGHITPEDKTEIKKELGDVLWYLASVARYLDIPLEDVAQTNITKLESRLKRGKLHGSGDNR